jgi:hypothetical protein
MTIFRLFVFSLLLSSVSLAAQDPKVLQASRNAMLESLFSRKYFKTGTCVDVANTFLEDAKLPIIPPNQKSPFPELKKQSGNKEKKVAYSLEMKPVKDSRWQIKWNHTSSQDSTPIFADTIFTFEAKQNDGVQTCSFKNFTIEAHLIKAPKGPATGNTPLKFDTISCLDTFLIPPTTADKSTDNVVGLIYSWIKQNCAVATHYSEDAAKMLAEIKGVK